jgi:hypothetical protein
LSNLATLPSRLETCEMDEKERVVSVEVV